MNTTAVVGEDHGLNFPALQKFLSGVLADINHVFAVQDEMLLLSLGSPPFFLLRVGVHSDIFVFPNNTVIGIQT